MFRVFIGLLLIVAALCVFAAGYITAALTGATAVSNATNPKASPKSTAIQSGPQSKSPFPAGATPVVKTPNLAATGGAKPNLSPPGVRSAPGVASTVVTAAAAASARLKSNSAKENKPEKTDAPPGNEESKPGQKNAAAPSKDKESYSHVGPPIVSFGAVTSASDWLRPQNPALSIPAGPAPGKSASAQPSSKSADNKAGPQAAIASKNAPMLLQRKRFPTEAAAAADLLPPEPATPKGPSRSAVYSVRLETHKSRVRAEKAVQRFKSDNIPAEIYVEIDERRKKWFTVVVGAFDTAVEAQEARARIKDKHNRRGAVVLIQPSLIEKTVNKAL